MFKLKHRKILFLFLIALLAGGSMMTYAHSEVNFVVKTVQLVLFQQFAAMAIYLTCFAPDLLRSRS